MRKILTAVAVPAVLSMALAAPALAARSSSATLTVSTAGGTSTAAASQPTAGSSLVFSGCGYEPGADVLVRVVSPTATTTYGEAAGSDGCISTADSAAFIAHDAGTYTAAAFQSSRRKADANLTFTVTN